MRALFCNRLIKVKFSSEASSRYATELSKLIDQFSEKLKPAPVDIPPAADLVIIRHCFKLKTTIEDWRSLDEYKHYKPHDTPLSKLGAEQAKILCNLMKRQKFDRILSSPYRRCIESLLPVVKHFRLKICLEPGLRETTKSLEHMDGFEKLEKLKQHYTFNNEHIFDETYEPVVTCDEIKSLETKHDSASRVISTMKRIWLEKKCGQNERILICTHSTPCGALMKHFCDEDVYFRFGTAAFLYENNSSNKFSFSMFNSLED